MQLELLTKDHQFQRFRKMSSCFQKEHNFSRHTTTQKKQKTWQLNLKRVLISQRCVHLLPSILRKVVRLITYLIIEDRISWSIKLQKGLVLVVQLLKWIMDQFLCLITELVQKACLEHGIKILTAVLYISKLAVTMPKENKDQSLEVVPNLTTYLNFTQGLKLKRIQILISSKMFRLPGNLMSEIILNTSCLVLRIQKRMMTQKFTSILLTKEGRFIHHLYTIIMTRKVSNSVLIVFGIKEEHTTSKFKLKKRIPTPTSDHISQQLK